MVMLSQFVLKGCKLQYNSSLKAANQQLAARYKAIRGRRPSATHRGGQEEIKNIKVHGCRFSTALLSRRPCLQLLLSGYPAVAMFVSTCGLFAIICLTSFSLVGLYSLKVTGGC